MNRARHGVVLLAVLLLNAVAGHSHTLAGTVVSVTMTRSNAVALSIAADADPLIAKLEALAGVAAAGSPASAAERRARLEALFPTLRAHIDARVAGEALALDLQDVAVDDTAHTEVRLTARLPRQPEGGRHERVDAFTWRCTFVFGAYQFTSTQGEHIEWLQGPQTSAPVALQEAHAEALSSAPRFTRVGHSLPVVALVVYVIYRRRGNS
jgi:hypothetical protein